MNSRDNSLTLLGITVTVVIVVGEPLVLGLMNLAVRIL